MPDAVNLIFMSTGLWLGGGDIFSFSFANIRSTSVPIPNLTNERVTTILVKLDLIEPPTEAFAVLSCSK